MEKTTRPKKSMIWLWDHDGSYRLKSYLLEPENKALLLQLTQEEKTDANLPDTLTINEVVERWTSLCAEINARLKRPDYEMSEKEFIKYKQIHLLNKKFKSYWMISSAQNNNKSPGKSGAFVLSI